MKKYLMLGLFTFCFTSYAAATGGTDVGNGGDDYSREFVSIALDIAESLALNPMPGVDAKSFLDTVSLTKVNSSPRIVLRGYEVDAVNYPDSNPPQIVVNRAGWDRLSVEPHRRAFLVLHEYLGIMKIDDSKYQISKLLDRASVCSRAPAIRDYLERYLKKSCYRIIRDDLRFVDIMNIQIESATRATIKKDDFQSLPRLKVFRFMGNETPVLFTNTFDGVAASLEQLILSAGFPDGINCSVFNNLSKLKHLSLGGAYTVDGRFFLSKVPASCFSKLPNLGSLTIALKTEGGFQSHGFLNGISSALRVLEVGVIGNELIPLAEFEGLKNYNLATFKMIVSDRKVVTESYLNGISQILGMNCMGLDTYQLECRKE